MNNINNVLITEKEIENIVNSNVREYYHIKVKNINMFRKAFTHTSYNIVNVHNIEEDNYSCTLPDITYYHSNERMEFLGDRVITFIFTTVLYNRYTYKDQGFLTKLKSKLECKDSLAYFADKLNFRKYILIGNYVENLNSRANSVRLMEDTFESFMAALYKCHGISVCEEFLITLFNKYINIDELELLENNYKDQLLKYFQKNTNFGNPVYFTIYDKILHNNTHEFGVVVVVDLKNINTDDYNFILKIHNNILNKLNLVKNKLNLTTNPLPKDKMMLSFANGTSKKESEQQCSKICLDTFSSRSKY
jgi:ribonuclease III